MAPTSRGPSKVRNLENKPARGAPGFNKLSGEYTIRTDDIQKRQNDLLGIASNLLPKFGPNWHKHGLVTLKVEALARILYYNELYQKIVNVPGVICEFGVQWGATLTQLINLRAIYEPFNQSRIIYGFDTFEGFPSVTQEDGGFSNVGDYSSVDGYASVLDQILTLQESFSPNAHVRKFGLVVGDAATSIDGWLRDHPHAIVSMAIFDMDLYKPTKAVLKKIMPRLTKGSLLVFDELNCALFPGETSALDEVVGINNLRLRRTPLQPYCAWAVYGE
jgi:hypothetical protein